MEYAKTLAQLIGQFERLPGIGPKSAQRMAFWILSHPREDAAALAEALLAVKDKIRLCPVCFNFTDEDVCAIDRDPRRDQSVICVVAETRDLVAMEKTNEYKGVYHVLHGVISPLDGIGPELLKVRELMQRLADGKVKEVILATNPTIEGDATALYLARLIKPLGIRVTRIAHGLPVGGDLDYADQATLVQALEWRRDI